MKYIFKELGKGFFIGVLVFIVITLIEYANGFDVFGNGNFWERFLINQLYSLVLYMANGMYFQYLIKQFEGKLFGLKNLSQGVFGGIIITLVSIALLRFLIEVVYIGRSFEYFIENENLSYYYISFLISSVVTSIFYAVYYYKYRQEQQVTEQKIIAGTASAKFDALKNQLDPHFLFNSLNVLTSLIEENPTAATKFTTSLSKVYRYVLEQKNKDLVTIDEELNFAKLYMSLLETRFEESIVFTVPETLSNPEAKVVPLALQLILENAVKHNQVMPSRKLHISITEEKGNLIVTNNLQPKKVLKDSTGVGLQNITQRYQLLTDKPVFINKTETHFSIAIPMLTKTIIMNSQDTYISEKKLELAKERVQKIKGFYIHLAIYLCFIPIFIWLYYRSSTGFPWVFFPIGGWGFGVLSHASEVFEYNPFFSKDWERKKIKEMMDKDDGL